MPMVQNFWTIEGEHKHVNDGHLSRLPLLVHLVARYWYWQVVNIWRRHGKRQEIGHKWNH